MRLFVLSFLTGTMIGAAVNAETVAPRASSSVWNLVPDSLSASPGDTLSLMQALSRVKHGSPALRALSYQVAGATALVDQAGAWPNPGVLFGAENVGGTYSGFDQSELSLWFSQEFELGGKRSNRVAHAARAADEVGRDATTTAFDLYLETKVRYADVVRAEEQWRLSKEADRVVSDLANSAEERVRAGATLTADAALATAAVVRTRLLVQDAESQRLIARIALSSLWGNPTGFDEPVTAAPLPTERLDADSSAAWADRSPAVKRLRFSSATRRAEVAVERSLRVPNLTIEAGARRIEADGASTLLFGVGVPLPVWDRRASAIRAADARLLAADLEIERARAMVAGNLTSRFGTLERLHERLRQTQDTLIPKIEAALENMRTAYQIGRASYADLLEVQRLLIDLHTDRNDTRFAIVAETVEIERLTGQAMEEMSNE